MKEIRKALSLNFEVVIKQDEHKFIGECKELPGLVVSGKDKAEVIRGIKAAIPLYLRYVPKESFIPVFENPLIPIVYNFEEFNGSLYASTNKDSVIRTITGDVGAWETITVTDIFAPYYNPPAGTTKSFDNELLGDYTPQIYCMKAFNDLGTPKLFCGTNASGGIYETLDGKVWSLSFNSGEARIHCLEAFKGRLFAGTSTEGKVYSYNGNHWVVALTTPELAITTMGIFRDYLYAGTYPDGVIYRTADGINWQKVFDTNQSFINDFCTYKKRLYVSTSKASGGLVLMSEDGINWIENFFSEKDVNFYKFAVFSNSLYLSTGDNGKIYKTLDGDKWEMAFQTDEEDVRALRVFNGYLYFGSSPKGRLFRTTVSNTPPPKITNVVVQEVSSHSALITWETDRESKTIVEYGLDEIYGNNIVNERLHTKHRITLNNLKSLMTYHFRILTYSDIGSFSGVLEDYDFTTSAAVTPVISSLTHADEKKWYNSSEADVFWGMHTEVKQYLYLVDTNPETVPDPAQCSVTVKDGVTIKGIEDGTCYVHLLVEDKAGNISQTVSHFRLNIDTYAAPPAVFSSTHPKGEKWYVNNKPIIFWETPHDFSGVEGYLYQFDEMPNTLPNDKTGTFTKDTIMKFTATEDGVKYFHIVSKDKAGNTGTKASHFRISIDTCALPPVISSKTHPEKESWYNKPDAEMTFAKTSDLSGIEGFFYTVDQRPDTVPTETNWVYTTATNIEIQGKPDGTWFVHARSKDYAGNISTDAAHFKFNIDTMALPPHVVSVSHPDISKWYTAKKAQFKITAPEDAAGIEGYYYVLDNNARTIPDASATWVENETIFSGELQDGEWYLHVVSKDRATNIGTQAVHLKINIDTTAKTPKVYSNTHPDQEIWYNNAMPLLAWETPEDRSGIECYYYTIDNKTNTVPNKDISERTTSNQLAMPMLADGIWYFHIVSKDKAGNVGWEAAHYKMKIDTRVDAPKVESATHPEKDKWYNTPRVKLSWNVPQDLSKIKGFYYLLSKEKHFKIIPGIATFTDTKEIELYIEEEGTYYFHIVCEDNAGNIGEEPEIYEIKVDLKAVAPAIISSTHPNSDRYYAAVNPVFIMDKIDDISGYEGFYYLVDKNQDTLPDKKNAKWTKDTTIKINEKLDDGEWYFHVVMKDKAGNLGTTAAVYKFKIETKAPETYIKPLGKFQNTETFDMQWEGEDQESGISCFTVEYREGEKGKWKVWLGETKVRNGKFHGEDGIIYFFRIKAKDNAGNWSEYIEDTDIKTTVDASPPSAVIQIVARPGKNGKIDLEWNKTLDGISGVAFYRIYRSAVSGQLGMQINDDGSGLETKFTDESRELEDGIIYYYTVRAVDNVGNERESGNKQALVICDCVAMPPVAKSITHPIQTEWYNNNDIKLKWETPLDATKVNGYFYIFDQMASTVPNEKTGSWHVANEIDFTKTTDGTWYFHIVSKDEAGNISEEASHYQINIDTSIPNPPVVTSLTHPDFNQWYNNNSPSFSWSTPSDQAGIEGYYYIFNQIKDTRPDIMTASWTKGTMASFVEVPDGVWYMHIVAKDNAGNTSTEISHFMVNVAMTTPPPLVFSSTHSDEEKWYRGREAKIQWKAREYVNDIIGYYYAFDQNENTIPAPRNNKTMETAMTFNDLVDGTYYFHIVAVDKEGIIGKTKTTFRIRIKTKVKLKGTITQSNGIMPLPGAGIEIMREDGMPLGTTVSDKDGDYEIDNLPVGKVRVKINVKNLPAQMITGIDLKEDEQEKVLNVSSEIFAMYDKPSEKILFNYFIPEVGLVTINTYTETGKLLNKIEENKNGMVYNNTYWDVSALEDGQYRFQITSKGAQTGKITRYAIRKIKKG